MPHSAKGTRQRINRQISLCRVLFVGHSAKPLPSAGKALGKDLHSAKWQYEKKPKNNSKIFFSGQAATGQRPPVSIEVAVIFEQISRLMWLVGFELTTSPSCVCCSTTALHCHLCLNSLFILIYCTKLRVNYLFEALNEFKSKSGQLQSFITFGDLQFSFMKFFHPRPFEKFEFQI